MKTNRFLVTAVILLIILNVVVIVFTIQRQDRRPPGRFRNDDRTGNFMQRRLDLSPAQVKSFDSLRDLHVVHTAELIRAIHDNREELVNMMKSSQDTTAMEQQVNALGHMNAQLEKMNVQHWIALRNLCTPEQTVRFDSLISKMINKVPFKGRTKRKHH